MLALIWRRTAWFTAVGVVAGLTVAYAASRSVQALLAGISAADAATYAAATTMAIVIALAGSIVPAWRAMRVDPVAAMRED